MESWINSGIRPVCHIWVISKISRLWWGFRSKKARRRFWYSRAEKCSLWQRTRKYFLCQWTEESSHHRGTRRRNFKRKEPKVTPTTKEEDEDSTALKPRCVLVIRASLNIIPCQPIRLQYKDIQTCWDSKWELEILCDPTINSFAL